MLDWPCNAFGLQRGRFRHPLQALCWAPWPLVGLSAAHAISGVLALSSLAKLLFTGPPNRMYLMLREAITYALGKQILPNPGLLQPLPYRILSLQLQAE